MTETNSLLRADEPPPKDGLAIVVATAVFTTIATGLAQWAVDELRAKYGSAKAQPTDETKR